MRGAAASQALAAMHKSIAQFRELQQQERAGESPEDLKLEARELHGAFLHSFSRV